MSPGFCARPPGRFSVAGTYPVTAVGQGTPSVSTTAYFAVGATFTLTVPAGRPAGTVQPGDVVTFSYGSFPWDWVDLFWNGTGNGGQYLTTTCCSVVVVVLVTKLPSPL